MKLQIYGILLFLAVIPSDPAGSEEHKASLFLRPGVFAGAESETPGYHENDYRVMLELGAQWSNIPVRYLDSFESVSLTWRFVFGTTSWDVRHSIGPNLEWKLSESWSATAMAAPAFGGGSRYGSGFHASTGLKYRKTASLDVLYYAMSPGRDLEAFTDDYIHSIYAGVTLHGKPGGYLALAIILGFVICAIVIVRGLAEGLGGLN